MGRIDKKKVIEMILERLQSELDAQLRAAKSAHEAATHEESRAEDQHDTRGLEASYLAGAQAARAMELQQLITAYRIMTAQDFAPSDPIGPGSLVEVELDEDESPKPRRSYYWIAPRGGGSSVQVQGVSIQVVTPQSPMGEALVGRKTGDRVEVEIRDDVREYQVLWSG